MVAKYSNTRAQEVGEKGVTVLFGVVKEGFPETVTFEQRSGRSEDGFEQRNA